MIEELKITKEAVLAAAESCPTAKNVLEKMFPAVFAHKNPMPRKGYIYKIVDGICRNGSFMWTSSPSGQYFAADFEGTPGNHYSSVMENGEAMFSFIEVANSPAEYFKQKYSK